MLACVLSLSPTLAIKDTADAAARVDVAVLVLGDDIKTCAEMGDACFNAAYLVMKPGCFWPPTDFLFSCFVTQHAL